MLPRSSGASRKRSELSGNERSALSAVECFGPAEHLAANIKGAPPPLGVHVPIATWLPWRIVYLSLHVLDKLPQVHEQRPKVPRMQGNKPIRELYMS